MKEQARIGPYQAVFLTATILFSGLAVIYAMDNELGRSQWLSLALPAIVGIILYFFYSWLLKCLRGQTLDQVYATLFGKLSGKLLAGYFLLFYLLLGGYFMVSAISFWAALDMPNTPLFIFIALTLLSCLLISRLGLEVIVRSGMLFLIAFLALAVIDTAFLLPEIRFERILPLANIADSPNLLSVSVKKTIVLFAPLPLVLHFLPLVNDQQRLKNSFKLGLLLAFAYLIIITLRNVLIFGDTLLLENHATLKALRLVEWGNGISRLELLSLIALLSNIFLAGACIFFAASKLLTIASGLKSSLCHYPLAIALGALMYILGISNQIESTTILMVVALAGLASILLLLITIFKLKIDCKQ